MTTFQLDQNINNKSLADKCNDEGKAAVHRFPVEWRDCVGGFKDPALLNILMAKDDPVLTNDREIASRHIQFVPSKNPGIIIVGFPPGHIRPIGKKDIPRIIAKFKAEFPGWHSINWSNSIAEITPDWIKIWHVKDGKLNQDEYLVREDPKWPQKLEDRLIKNARAHRDPYILPKPTDPETSN